MDENMNYGANGFDNNYYNGGNNNDRNKTLIAIIACCLAVAVACSAVVVAVMVKNKNSRNNGMPSAYDDLIQEVLNECESNKEVASGVLYDVDGDGVDELVMMHDSESYDGYDDENGKARVCRVYTLSNGKSVRLVEDIIFYDKDGGSGDVCVVERDGEYYISVTGESSEKNGNTNGFWNLYNLTDGHSDRVHNTTYTKVYDEDGKLNEDDSKVTMNGEDVGFDDYENEQENYDPQLSVNNSGDKNVFSTTGSDNNESTEESEKKEKDDYTGIGLYQDVIEEALGKSEYNDNGAKGYLYDLYSDSVKELVMMYATDFEEEPGITQTVTSVYTIKDGEVKALLDEKQLYVHVAGPFGCISIVKENGKVLFCTNGESGETSGEYMHRHGFWDLYSYDGDDFNLEYDTEYDYYGAPNDIKYDMSEADVNGEIWTYREYKNWLDDGLDLVAYMSDSLSGVRDSNGNYEPSEGKLKLVDVLEEVKKDKAQYDKEKAEKSKKSSSSSKKSNTKKSSKSSSSSKSKKDSYKDSFIDAIIKSENESWNMESAVGGHGYIKMIDMNFDGKMEFIQQHSSDDGFSLSSTSPADVYYYEDGKLIRCETVCGLNNELTAYYNQEDGNYFFLQPKKSFHGYDENYALENQVIEFVSNDISKWCYSCENEGLYYDGLYHSDSVNEISKEEYDAINEEVIKDCVKVNMQYGKIERLDWLDYSESEKREALERIYDEFSYDY